MGSLFERQMKALLLFDGQSDSEWRVGELKFRDASEGFDLNLGADGRKWKRCRQPVCQKDFRVAMGVAHKFALWKRTELFLSVCLNIFQLDQFSAPWGRGGGGVAHLHERRTQTGSENYGKNLLNLMDMENKAELFSGS